MGRSTYIYTGWIIKAKMTKKAERDEKRACVKKPSHSVDYHDKFCKHCGEVKDISVTKHQYYALNNIQWDEDIQTIPQQTIVERFEAVPSDFIDNRDPSIEYLVAIGKNAPDWIDADCEGIHLFKGGLPDCPQPTQDWLDLLKGAMEYESVEVCFGTLVKRS